MRVVSVSPSVKPCRLYVQVAPQGTLLLVYGSSVTIGRGGGVAVVVGQGFRVVVMGEVTGF